MTSNPFAQARKALGWTQEQCAAVLRVNRATVAAWEVGRQQPPHSAELVLRLAQVSAKNKALCEATLTE